MKFFTFLTVLLFTAYSYSQTTDHTGYYITNAGEKVEGYFKQTDFFKSNMLNFKSSLTGEYEHLSPDNIIEYGIGSDFKFIKQTIKIDKSDNNNVKMYSSVKDPQFVTETLFLNVLVEGKDASLYSADINKSIRYFYASADKNQITQLIYKKYASVQDITAVNKEYQKQLYTDINCKNEAVGKFTNIDYNRDQLIKIFTEFNACKGSEPVIYQNNTGNKSKIVYGAFIGAYNNILSIEGERMSKVLGSSISYGLGAEIGFLTPSRNWEFFLRAEYEKLNGETSGFVKNTFNEETTTASLDAYVLNVHIGPRYYITFNEKSKLFFDAAIGLNSPSGDYEVKVMVQPNVGPAYQAELNKYSLNNSASFNFGIGYTFNNLGIRFLYETPRKMFDSTEFNITTDITRYGINLRYTLN